MTATDHCCETKADQTRLSTRRLAAAVMVMTLLLPVVIAITIFPTPMGDLREQIAWGREFPLVTPHHPPLMVWLSGVVDHFFGPVIVPQIVAGQLLFLVGALYLYAVLRLVTEPDNAFLFAFLYTTGFFVILGPSSWVMNADTLQITSWPPIVYHFLRAARSDRWRHWLMLGAWAALAVLTKYTAVVLGAGMGVAILALPEFRTVLRRPGLYMAVIVTVALVSPHLLALVQSPAAIKFGLANFVPGQSLGVKLWSLVQLAKGYMMLLAPAWFIVGVGWWRGDLAWRRPAAVAAPWPGALRFVLIVNGTIMVVLVAMIMIGNLVYKYRFGAPFAAVAIMGLAPLLGWNAGRSTAGERRIVRAVGYFNPALVAVMTIMYLGLTSHSMMQEPYHEPTRAILADWHGRYACGPAYVIGHHYAAPLIGIHAGPQTTALDTEDIAAAQWFDPARLRAQGAVVIAYSPISQAATRAVLPDVTLSDEKTLTCPLLRTFSRKTITYHYRFIAPQSCPD